MVETKIYKTDEIKEGLAEIIEATKDIREIFGRENYRKTKCGQGANRLVYLRTRDINGGISAQYVDKKGDSYTINIKKI